MKCVFPVGRGRCGPCTQATSPHPDVCYTVLSCCRSPWCPRGLWWQSWGSSTLLPAHGVMALQGSQVNLFLVGPRKGPLSASSTLRHTQVDFSGQPDKRLMNVVVFLFVIKCCINYTAEVYAHAWPKCPSSVLALLHLANSGSKSWKTELSCIVIAFPCFPVALSLPAVQVVISRGEL